MEYTPLIKQYFSIVDKYPGAIVLMRVGDFYETYGHIAVETSKALGITLTKRAIGNAEEMATALEVARRSIVLLKNEGL
jgi:DNA mismatch repair protein MutS